jgi:hypothetical protein
MNNYMSLLCIVLNIYGSIYTATNLQQSVRIYDASMLNSSAIRPTDVCLRIT